MRANEFLAERLDYSAYIPVLHRLISDIFNQVVTDEYSHDAKSKVNTFFYELQELIDTKILTPLLKKNPIVIEQVPIRFITVSFKPTFTSDMGKMSMGSVSANVQRSLKKQYPDAPLPKGGTDTIAQYIKSHLDFTGEAEFNFDPETKNAIIRIDVRGSEVANYLFNSDNTAIATASLKTLTSNIAGKLFHEIKHFIQGTKVTKNFGFNAQVNKFYTGNPKKIDKNKHYATTKSGYWLNSNEMDSWAANAAAEINNIFGHDVDAINQYMNIASKGQTTSYNNVPVNTSLNHYYSQIFNPRYKVNTDRQTLWRKFIKDVYKDLQHYQGKK